MPSDFDNSSKISTSVVSDVLRIQKETHRALGQIPPHLSLVVKDEPPDDKDSDAGDEKASQSKAENSANNERRSDPVMSRWKNLRENSLSLPMAFLLGLLVASCIERSVGDDGASAEAKAEAKCGFNEIDRALIMDLYQNRLDYRRPHCHKH